MITITFPDRDTEKKALGFLLGHFSGRVLKTGEHLVPESALADRNIPFSVCQAGGRFLAWNSESCDAGQNLASDDGKSIDSAEAPIPPRNPDDQTSDDELATGSWKATRVDGARCRS